MAASELPGVGNTVLLIGVGGAGCALAAQCAGARARRLLDFNAAALERYDADETVCIAGDGQAADDLDVHAMRHAAEETALELAGSLAAGNTVALLLGAVGGQTGAVVLPALADEFKSVGTTVIVVALEPLPMEGAGRADLASRTIAELENTADLVLLAPNRPLADLCDPDLPVGRAITALMQKAVAAAEQLIRALTCSSCVGLQPSEVRRSLGEAGRGAIGVGTGSGDARVEKAIRDACANSFLTQEACQHASAAVLHLLGSRDLSLKEVHGATELVAQLVGRVPIQVGLTIDPAAGDDLRATLLVTGIRRLEADALPDDAATCPATQAPDLNFYDGVNLDIPAFLRRRPAHQLRY